MNIFRGRSRKSARIVLLLVVLSSGAGFINAVEPGTWLQRSVMHLEAFEWGRPYLARGYQANDRISNDLTHQVAAYLSIYRVSRDKSFIDLAASQLDIAAAGTDRWYRDGVGWSTPRYSQTLVKNGSLTGVTPTKTVGLVQDGFETPAADPTLPANWVRVQSTPQTAFRDGGSNGSSAVVLRTDGSNWTSLQLARDLKPDTFYLVAAEGRTNHSGVYPNIDAHAGALWFQLTPLQRFPAGIVDEWRPIRFTFRTPPDLTTPVQIRLVVSSYTSGAEVRFDNFEIQEATAVAPSDWEYINAKPENVTVHDGVRLINDGIRWQNIGQRLMNPYVVGKRPYEPGAKYRVRAAARSSEGVDATITIWDETSGTTLGQRSVNGAEYREVELEFTAPDVPNHSVLILLNPSPYNTAGAWADFKDVDVRQFAGHLIDEAQIVNAFLSFALAVRGDAALTTYETKAEHYTALAESVVDQWTRDWVQTADYGVFRYFDDGSSGPFARATVPTNYYTEAGISYIRLHRLTGKAEYRTKATLLARALRRAMRMENGEIIWDYYKELLPTPDPPPESIQSAPEDLSHSNATVLFIIECVRENIEFTATDLEALANLFIRRMWNQNLTNPRIAGNLAGGASQPQLPAVWNWALLSDFNPRVLSVLHAAVEPYVSVDRSSPIHDYLHLWYDQGWRGQLKAYLAEALWERGSLRNADFSTDITGKDWRRHDYSAGTAAIENGAVRIDASGTTAWNVVEQVIADPSESNGYRPNATYLIQFMGRVVGANRGLAYVQARPSNRILVLVSFSNSEWQRHEVSFMAPAAGEELWLRFQVADRDAVGTSMNVDDVLVLRTDPAN